MLTCLIEPCLQRKGSECCGLGPSRPVPVFEVPGGERVCVYVCVGGMSGLRKLPCSSCVDPGPKLCQVTIMSVFLLAFPHPDLD